MKCDHRRGICAHVRTLTQALREAGYTHRAPEREGVPHGAHDIIDASGNVVATLKSSEAWEWLRALERQSNPQGDRET